MLDARKEMKIISYLKYLWDMERNNKDNITELKQVSAEYLRVNELDTETLYDIFAVNYLNRYHVIIYYMIKTKAMVRDYRTTLNDLYREKCSNFRWYNKVDTDELNNKLSEIFEPQGFNYKQISKFIKCCEVFTGMFNSNSDLSIEEMQKEILAEVFDHYNGMQCYVNYIKFHKPNYVAKGINLSNIISSVYSDNSNNAKNKKSTLERLTNLKTDMQNKVNELLKISKEEV